MAGLVLGGGLVRMIPVRKDWYLGGRGVIFVSLFIKLFFFSTISFGGGVKGGIYSGFRGLPTLVIIYH